MASYFGSTRPAQAYRTKVRWLLGCLSSLIMVLVATLIYIVSLSDVDSTPGDITASNFAHASAVSYVKVLIPNQRIEVGETLNHSLFRAEDIPIDAVPLGVVKAAEDQLVWGKFADSVIMANQPLLHSDVTKRVQPGELIIPPGYRAATIQLDARQVVAGYVGPNKRVDVLLTYKDPRGIRTVDTIIEYAKVLSFNGYGGNNTNQSKNQTKKHNTVTLQVTQRDASRLELARQMGSLSLSLRGGIDTGEDINKSGPIQPTHVVESFVQEDKDPNVDGTIYYEDPRTGKQIRRQLVNRRWERAEAIGFRDSTRDGNY